MKYIENSLQVFMYHRIFVMLVSIFAKVGKDRLVSVCNFSGKPQGKSYILIPRGTHNIIFSHNRNSCL